METATHKDGSYSRDKNSRLDRLSSLIQKHPMATIAVATSVVAIISLYYCHLTTAELPDSVHLEKATIPSSSKKRLFPLLDHTCQVLPSVFPTAVSNLSLNETLGNSTQYIAIKPVSTTLVGDMTRELKTHIPVELPLKVTQDIILQSLPTCPLTGNNSLGTDEFKNGPKDTPRFTSAAKEGNSIQADYNTLFHGYSLWTLGGLTTLAIYYLYERLQAKNHHLLQSNKKALQLSTDSSSINPSLQRRAKDLIMSPGPTSSSPSKHLGLELPTHRPYSDNKGCKTTDLQESSKARTLSESAKKYIYQTYRKNLCNNPTEYDHTLAIWIAIRAYKKKKQSDPHLTRDQIETIIKETDLKHRKAEYQRIRRNLGDAGVVSKVEEAKILEKYEQIPNKFHELLAWYNKGKSMKQQITLPQLIKILQLRYPYLGTTLSLKDKT